MVRILMSHDKPIVPFNDLRRIHAPLLPEFLHSLEKIVEESALVLGGEVDSFEISLARIEGANYAVGVNNGTNAIELALRALGIGPGDEVLLPSFTFVATAFAVLQVGAIPVLVDVEIDTGIMDLESAQEAVSPRTKGLIFVTIHGRTDNLQSFQDFCQNSGIRFIIDGAQSHLGTFKNSGLANYCDISTLSFYPGKNLGALGEGGAVLTNSVVLDEKLRLMRDWGAKQKYDHSTWGGNFRLEPLQASFLHTKLQHLPLWTSERIRIANTYYSELDDSCLMAKVSKDGSHVFHIFALKFRNRDLVIKKLQIRNISFGLHYPRAVHQNPFYAKNVKKVVDLSKSEMIASQTLSIPIFPFQTDEEIDRVIAAVKSV
jgi:dTDP-4-amino-4,6-dideoxygalactose transaminase